MPKPNKGEEKNDYLKRCTEQVAAEGHNPDQAFAICNRFWDDSKKQRAALTLSVPVTLAVNEAGEPGDGFMITAYTGQIIDMGFWGRFVFDLKGMKMAQKIPILREHERDRVVGYSTKTWADGANLLLSGKFSGKTEDGREVKELALDGFPWQASIGVWPKKLKVLESAKDKATVNGVEMTGPLEIWTESQVREVSFVALGADGDTAAIALNLQELDKVPVSFERAEKKEKEATMPEITMEMLLSDAPALVEEIRAAAKEGGYQDGQKEERERVLKILQANGDMEIVTAGIADGSPALDVVLRIAQAKDDFKAKTLAQMQDEAPPSMGQGVQDRAPETLSADEKALCKSLNLTEEQFLAGKKALAQRGE